MAIEVEQSSIPLPARDASSSVGEIRSAMRVKLAKGESVICPCCGGTSKVYARGIHAKMVRALIEVSQVPAGITPAALSSLTAGGDAQKLSHWGLIDRDSKTGLWLITNKGRRWLAGEIQIPHKVITYGAEVIGFDSSKMISVSDVRHASVDLADILAAWGTQEEKAA